MTPIHRPPCPDFMLPYSANVPEEAHPDIYAFRKLVSMNRGQTRMPTNTLKLLRSYLVEIFNGKCCYCESSLGAATEGDIEHFRPWAILERSEGQQHHVYWYMVLDWRNTYLACPTCNRYKSNRFPVSGPRARAGVPYDEVLASEKPVLIDPCNDVPDEHLVFLDNGEVVGLSSRGEGTINLLRLNRPGLVSARLDVISRFESASAAEQQEPFPAAAPYAGVWRQRLRLSKHPELAKKQLAEGREIEQRNPQISDPISTEDEIGLDSYRAVAQYVERIRIENFGPIRHLDLDLSQSKSPKAPCFALLGENGVGKSTVLRALAMALSGKAYTKRLRLTSNDCLPDDAFTGEVRVSLAGHDEDLIMSLKRNRQIQFSNDKSRSLVLAYGATRLLPRGKHKPKEGEKHAKIDNLFDPFLPLTEPEAWLSTLKPARMTDVNAVLENLLPKEQPLRIVRDGDTVRVVLAGDPGRKIRELSDGYQSMLGMAVDIMKVLYLVFESMESAEGIVIIDELGNHFHPAWRLRCVSALREAFPRTQFIYSTHDPLCLRGLRDGEVAVLMRDKQRLVYAMDDLPSVEKLRIEQILSSEHFGLRSTTDPMVDEQIREYEQLLTKVNRTPEEEIRLEQLVQNLTDVRYLGTTRREQMALQLLDLQWLPEVPTQSSVSAKNLSDSTVTKLQRLMKTISPSQEIKR